MMEDSSADFPSSSSSCKPWKFLCKTLINTISVVGGFGLVLLVPPFLLLLSPFYIWRYIAIFYTKLFRPDLGRIMTTRSSIIGVDSIYEKPLANLVVKLIVDGNAQGNDIRALCLQHVIESTYPNSNGQLKHPELQQSVVDWMGFKFWKWDTNFDIKNHIKVFVNDSSLVVTCEADLEKIVLDFKEKPFKRGQSPWEWIIIENFYEQTSLERSLEDKSDLENVERRKTILLTRFHHSLVDGYSTTKLVLRALGEIDNVKLIRREFPQSSRFKKMLNFLGLCIKAPFELVRMSFDVMDENPWHLKEEELSRKSYIGFLKVPIPLEKFKSIKQIHNVSVTAILLAAMAGAIRTSMIRNGVSPPKFINCGLPLPYPNHPDKLRNHIAMAMTKLPVGFSSRESRLLYCHKKAIEMKVSTIPIITFKMMPLVGGLPSFIVKRLAKNMSTTVLLSNFPGPYGKAVNAAGFPVTILEFCGGFGAGRTGFGFTALSYMENLLMGAQADRALFPSKDVFLMMLQDFESEVNSFLMKSIVDDERVNERTNLIKSHAINITN